MQLRLLNKNDAKALLCFELKNRQWFERTIDARADEFYSSAGVAAHIKDELIKWQAGLSYPCVIESDGHIIARVNLRKIDKNFHSAFLGYRVAENESGKGVASFSVESILSVAKNELGLKTILAYVTEVNIASKVILEKFSFKEIAVHRELANVAGEKLDCLEFKLDFDVLT